MAKCMIYDIINKEQQQTAHLIAMELTEIGPTDNGNPAAAYAGKVNGNAYKKENIHNRIIPQGGD